MAIDSKQMTADELLGLPDDGLRHELIEGELTTMAPSGMEHAGLVTRLSASLANVVGPERLGTVFSGDPGFVIRESPDTVRAPDVAFLSRARVIAVGRVAGYWRGAPDLAIEVISPNDLYTDVERKVFEWLDHGCTVVLVVNPRRQTVAEYRVDRPVRIYTVTDTLSVPDVIPGWSLPVRELFGDE